MDNKNLQSISQKIETTHLNEVKRKEEWMANHPNKTERDWLLEERATNERQKALLLQLFKVIDENDWEVQFGTSWNIPHVGKVFSDFSINGVYYDLKMPQLINDTFDPSRPWDAANQYIDWKLGQLAFPEEMVYSTRSECYNRYNWVHDNYVAWTYLIPNQEDKIKEINPKDLDKLIKDFSEEKDASKRVVVWCDMPHYESQFNKLKIYFDSLKRTVLGTLTPTAKTLIALSRENSLIAVSIVFKSSFNNLFVNDLTKYKVSIVYGSDKKSYNGCIKYARKIEEDLKLPSMYWFDIKDHAKVEKLIRLHGCEQYLCKDTEHSIETHVEPTDSNNIRNIISEDKVKEIIADYLNGKSQPKPLAVWCKEDIQEDVKKSFEGNGQIKNLYLGMCRSVMFPTEIVYSDLANEINSSKEKPKLMLYFPEFGDSCNEGIIAYGTKVSELTGIPVIFFLNSREKDSLNSDNKCLVEEVSCFKFKEGLALVKVDGKWGFIDTNGEYIISPQFDVAGDFHEGLAAVGLNRKIGYVNKKGELQIKPQFEEADDFHEGLAGVCLNGKWGFIDSEGELVIPYRFDDVKNFNNGIAQVKLDGKWLHINNTGDVITK